MSWNISAEERVAVDDDVVHIGSVGFFYPLHKPLQRRAVDGVVLQVVIHRGHVCKFVLRRPAVGIHIVAEKLRRLLGEILELTRMNSRRFGQQFFTELTQCLCFLRRHEIFLQAARDFAFEFILCGRVHSACAQVAELLGRQA